MISFIIIGRNEELMLSKCLESVVKAIDENSLHAEIIYVDSQSTDKSVEIAKSFEPIRVVRITGNYNAAIARNIGASLALSSDLFFIDADMELVPDFMPHVVDDKQELKYEFVSGNFINIYYSIDGEIERKDFYKKVYCKQDTFQPTTGGLFAIRKELWEKYNGMRPMFRKGQDLDFGYRLAKAGHLLLRLSKTMAHHHTVDYKDGRRIWKSLMDGSNVYPRAILYRSQINNPYVLKRMLSSDPTLLILFLVIIMIVLTGQVILFVVYVLVSFVALLYSLHFKVGFDFIFRFINHICRDVINLFAFFLFFPSKKLRYEFEEL